MKLLTKSQIRELDKRTIEEENIPSIDLMERAATALSNAIKHMFQQPRTFKIFAGPGNNGGDALAVARMLVGSGHKIEVYLFNPKGHLSDDCQTNAERLLDYPEIQFTEVTSHFAPVPLLKSDIVIDGLFGSGLNKALDGGFAAVAKYINASPAMVISIDIPSGLMCEDNSYNISENIIKADTTLSLQLPKLAFFLPENQKFIGEWFCLDIRLSQQGQDEAASKYHVTTMDMIRPMLKARNEFSHKGTYGHALLIAGSHGMAGASVLAARACMRSGVGLLTVHAPLCNNPILQTAIPEAMVHHDENEHHFATPLDSQSYTAVAIGPGLGQHEETARALHEQLEFSTSPIILDADALNILAGHKTWLPLIPKHSILTPHPKELERLIGHCSNSYERLTRTQELAERMCINIILKGAWTAVVTSDGVCHFNPTGNPGMATAGSGDVLTGVLLALMAQGYSPEKAAIIGTYIHGGAGDLAAEEKGESGMIASDIVDNLPLVWSQLKKNSYLCSNKELKCY